MGGDIRKSLSMTEGGWLDALPRGAQSRYVRWVLDRHVAALRGALQALRASRTNEDLAEILAAYDVPCRLYATTPLATLRKDDLEAATLLLEELEATELGDEEDGVARLLAALDSGVPA